MKSNSRWRPTPSFVISCLALFVALSGTAVALQGQNRVKSNDIAPNAVHRSDIRGHAVNASKVANDSLTGGQINESTLDGTQIPGTGGGGGGGGTPTGPAGGDLSGTYPNPQIGTGAVDTPELAPLSVTSSKVGRITVRSTVFTVGANQLQSGATSCQAGEKAVSGGVNTNSANQDVTDTFPTGAASGGVDPTGWSAIVRNTGAQSSFRVSVLCLQA